MVKLTNQQQGDELGIGERYVQRLRQRGLPEPKPKETKARWKARAQKWMAEHVNPKGANGRASAHGDPDDPESHASYSRRWRRARALREELLFDKERELVHGRAECYAEQVRRLEVLLTHFERLPLELSKACGGQPAETILEEARRLVRAAFDGLQQHLETLENDARTAVHDGDARGPAVAGEDVAEPVGRAEPSPGKRKR